MSCRLCWGQGNLFVMQNGKAEWYTCPACNGAGVRHMYGPKEIKMGPKQSQMMRRFGTTNKKWMKAQNLIDDIEKEHMINQSTEGEQHGRD